ncbi:hypothetical protein L1987_24565 [Smallanthus sonchifolius]|uniref:Uncharacterized protein n=1 Tax=Smallanthus sonchifolius TaxID=185202 RepID=A0ACB9IMJ6_9ASTR|nr:hypothetical protein L1987_24565 [Smallanthus sonchifolius]
MVNSEMPRKRVAFVLIDGLGDVSIPRFGYKTPLEAAKVLNLDAIASAGVNGLMDPVEVGLGWAVVVTLLIFLCWAMTREFITVGEARLNQWVLDWPWRQGTLLLKYSNFATLDEKTGVVTSRRADRHFEEEGPILCAALDKMKLPSFPEYEVRVRYATEHRCGVVVKRPKLSGNISGTDPLKDNRLLLEAQPLDNTEEAKHTAKVVNELSKEISRILGAHPLNKNTPLKEKTLPILSFYEAAVLELRFLHLRRTMLRPCMVAPTKIIAGLGLSLGIDILEASGATGD